MQLLMVEKKEKKKEDRSFSKYLGNIGKFLFFLNFDLSALAEK